MQKEKPPEARAAIRRKPEHLVLYHRLHCVQPIFYLPVPVRFEVCGLPKALSTTFNDPVNVPAAVGLKTTLILQLVLGARLVVQVVVETLNSPLVETTMLVSDTLCVFARVKTLAGLVVPTFVAA